MILKKKMIFRYKISKLKKKVKREYLENQHTRYKRKVKIKRYLSRLKYFKKNEELQKIKKVVTRYDLFKIRKKKLPYKNINTLIISFKKNNTFLVFQNYKKQTFLHGSCGLVKETHKKKFLKSVRYFIERSFRVFSNKILRKYTLSYRYIRLKVKGLPRKSNYYLFNIFRITMFKIIKIINITKVPHNGCRAKKIKRK